MPGAEQIIFFTKRLFVVNIEKAAAGVELILAVCERLRQRFEWRLSGERRSLSVECNRCRLNVGRLSTQLVYFLSWLTSSMSIPNKYLRLQFVIVIFAIWTSSGDWAPHTKKKNDQRQFLYFIDSFRKREWFAFRSDDGIKVFVLLIFIFRSLL